MEKINFIDSSSSKSNKDVTTSKYSKINQNEELSQINQIELASLENGTSLTTMSDFEKINPITIEKHQKYFYKRLGNTFSFIGDKNGNPLIIIGPHWPMYLCFSSLVTGGVFLFFISFWSYMNIIFKILGLLVYGTFIGSYTHCFLINPGYPKHDLDSKAGLPREKFRFCERCKMWVNLDKKPNHCFECDICIEGYDHHCPWTSKCIGRRNLNSFYVFVVSVLLVFAYIVCALTNAQSNYPKKKEERAASITILD